ncbi:MAG: FMN-dependent NADH-azoreductase [Sulfitobacter sp.]|jgi:FMN-dependent NADH-azoreductase
MTILRVDSSANLDTSVTRDLTSRIIETLGDSDVITRDLAAAPLGHITQSWATDRTIAKAERSAAQNETMALTTTLVDELNRADTLVIGVPVYNFSIPSALKAWIDLIALPGETFRYTEAGPEGLLKGKRAILAVASGGVPVGSPMDFASGYMRHVLGFLGITDVTIIAADALAQDAEGTLARAHSAIQDLSIAA